MGFLSLFTGMRGIIAIAAVVLLAAIGSWAFVQKRNVEQARLERDQAIAQRNQAGVERDKAIAAAKANEETIARLLREKELINQALTQIEESKVANRAAGTTREVIIERESKVPKNRQQAAPILGTIIENIQADRERRRRPATAASAPAR